MSHVFISYSRQDTTYVEQLADALRAKGFDVWIDYSGLEPSSIWWKAIERGIETCGTFVLIKSPASDESPWVHKEVTLALHYQKPIFPLLLHERDDGRLMFGLLADTQHEDVRGGALPPERFFRQLAKHAVQGHQSGASVAPSPPTEKPARSWGRITSVGVAAMLIIVILIVMLSGGWSILSGGPSATLPLMTQIALLEQTATADSWTDTPTNPPTDTPDLTATYHGLETNAALTAAPSATSTPAARAQALALAEAGVTRNADWTPYTENVGGVQIALVPAGCFMMGSTDEELETVFTQCEAELADAVWPCSRSWFDHEQPPHEVCFEQPYWIDLHEATNADFATFLNAQGNQTEGGATWLDTNQVGGHIHEHDTTWTVDSGYENHPAIGISWYGAAAYCQWRQARLPTEAEWEFAARGPDRLIYPWGNDWNANCSIGRDNSGNWVAAVGSMACGASWTSANDLSGNTYEWVADWYGVYTSEREVDPQGPGGGTMHVLRGGSAGALYFYQRAAYRTSAQPGDWGYLRGFRCARSYEP